ncbi:DUF262 domain-containing protein [Methanosphaerula subterraneus]|uniref:DUF262 domain-containing protein n=1 Tax=Methanosphaerula subterraneus TaxID=3350244 RepID=UPI003F8773D4
MKAGETNLFALFNGTRQFIIPIYQRNYRWELQNCEELWNDIVRATADPTRAGHFLGSIVYINNSRVSLIPDVPQFLVIDGQQRLTTISLFILALVRAIPMQDPNANAQRLISEFLLNEHYDGDLRNKLILTRVDQETYQALLNDRDLPRQASPRIVENFHFFEDRIRQSHLSPTALYDGIRRLFIVQIALDYDQDNPQRIFESLNSTGLDLSQTDQIRNFVLMDQDPREQRALYEDYWYPMELLFGKDNPEELFDRFMRDYLTVHRDGRIPKMGEVYREFKTYVRTQDESSVRDLVVDIHRFSKYFVRMACGKEEDPVIAAAFNDLNILKVDVAYPFLLQVYHDYRTGEITRDELVEVVRLVESYVFRRAVCGIPTNSMNKTFAALGKEIRRDDYIESVKAALFMLDSYRRFPDDAEFMREIERKDVYNSRICRYLLTKLENHGTKEPIAAANYTVEHIMPQNPGLSEAWQQELGDDWQQVHQTYLHTLGNLTLTGYNSELSDRPFAEKRDMEGGLGRSPLRLSAGLGDVSAWNEQEILLRAERLARLAARVWPAPDPERLVIPPPLPNPDHMRWTEERFMPVLEERAGTDAVEVARSILDWGVRHTTHIWWGEGKKDGSFAPIFNWKGESYYPVLVWTRGVLVIQFQWLQNRPPFNALEKRKELLDRLNAIPGIAIPEDSLIYRPALPLRAFLPAKIREEFFAVLDWVISEVKENV